MLRVLSKALLSIAMLAGVAGLTGCNGANPDVVKNVNSGKTGFLVKSIEFEGSKQNYGLFIPHSYTPTKKYPAIVFLHGVGEGGNDAQKNMIVGLGPIVYAQQSTFDMIVIFPQSGGGGWSAEGDSGKEAIAVLKQVEKDYSVDTDCVTLTGLSTGGYGTWAIGATYKQYFSALVPMGSSSDPSKYAAQLTDMPIRSYHNFGDWAAGEWNDSGMADKVNSLGGKVVYTQTHGGGHNCWDEAYASGDLFAWMKAQRKRGTAGSPTSPTKTSSPTTPTTPAGKTTSMDTSKPAVPVSSAPVKSSATPATPSKGGEQALVPTVY